MSPRFCLFEVRHLYVRKEWAIGFRLPQKRWMIPISFFFNDLDPNHLSGAQERWCAKSTTCWPFQTSCRHVGPPAPRGASMGEHHEKLKLLPQSDPVLRLHFLGVLGHA